jgi:hypothetical protein
VEMPSSLNMSTMHMEATSEIAAEAAEEGAQALRLAEFEDAIALMVSRRP